MDISRLDHVNLRTHQLQVMIDWYTDILGFEKGPRPNFPFGGAWMYRHGYPLVHLVDVSSKPDHSNDLHLEHAAFSSTGLPAFRKHLSDRNIRTEEVRIEDFKILQVNIWDPDGNHLHIDFDLAEAD